MDPNIYENPPKSPQSKSARKKQRAKERDIELKETDRGEWERQRKHKSEYGKLWRQRNPDKCTEYAKRSNKKSWEKRNQWKIDLFNSMHFPKDFQGPQDFSKCGSCKPKYAFIDDKTDYTERGFM